MLRLFALSNAYYSTHSWHQPLLNSSSGRWEAIIRTSWKSSSKFSGFEIDNKQYIDNRNLLSPLLHPPGLSKAQELTNVEQTEASNQREYFAFSVAPSLEKPYHWSSPSTFHCYQKKLNPRRVRYLKEIQRSNSFPALFEGKDASPHTHGTTPQNGIVRMSTWKATWGCPDWLLMRKKTHRAPVPFSI